MITRNSPNYWARVFVVILLIQIFPTVYAEANSDDISGIVSIDGVPIENVEVNIMSYSSGELATVFTDASGLYSLTLETLDVEYMDMLLIEVTHISENGNPLISRACAVYWLNRISVNIELAMDEKSVGIARVENIGDESNWDGFNAKASILDDDTGDEASTQYMSIEGIDNPAILILDYNADSNWKPPCDYQIVVSAKFEIKSLIEGDEGNKVSVEINYVAGKLCEQVEEDEEVDVSMYWKYDPDLTLMIPGPGVNEPWIQVYKLYASVTMKVVYNEAVYTDGNEFTGWSAVQVSGNPYIITSQDPSCESTEFCDNLIWITWTP